MTRPHQHPTTQQIFVWMPPLGGDREYATRVLDFSQKPTRMWTLYPHMDESQPPTFPYKPQHNVNAFLEDKVHDWDWSGGKLRYYSRVVGTQEGVWLLLEW